MNHLRKSSFLRPCIRRRAMRCVSSETRLAVRRTILATRTLNIGQEAPYFNLNDIDGRPVNLSDLRGKVVVLHFWGTECGWCQFIYSALRGISHEYPDEVALVGFSDDRSMGALRDKIAEEKFTWPQVCEGNGWKDAAFGLYNVTGIPCEYVIDQSGKIALKLSGGGEGSPEELEGSVRSLVAE